MQQYLSFIPQGVLNNIIFTIIALLVAAAITSVLKEIVRISARNIRKRGVIPEQLIGKSNTFNSVLYSIIDAITYIVTFLIILSKWSVDISPILTSAGIAGLAVSFGSQTLIKDLISGLFILAENQFNIGDRVKIGDHVGRVTRITLRLTVLKDDTGNRIFIPNSEIKAVIRLSEQPENTLLAPAPKTARKK